MKNYSPENKLGWICPKNYRINRFSYIQFDYDSRLNYEKTNNFAYDEEEQNRLLYYSKPCIYTDNRFDDFNCFSQDIWSGRRKSLKDKKKKIIKGKLKFPKKITKKFNYNIYNNTISLKSCFRKINKIKGIPVNTIIELQQLWYYPGTNVNNKFIYKTKKEIENKIVFEINKPSFFNNFTYCEFSKQLTNRLRNEGFIVTVYNENPHRLIGDCEGEISIAYGYGKRIGYSSKNNTYQGYSNGCDNILYDFLGEFDKWSRCIEIPKSSSIDEIVNILKTNNKNL